MRLSTWMVPAAIATILVIMAIAEPRFYSRLNMLNILRNASLASIVAVGQMLVIMVGGFDMAIGASTVLAAVLSASVMTYAVAVAGLGDVQAILAGIGAGLSASIALGAVSGALVARLGLNPFMATLAVATTTTGLVLYHTNGVSISGVPDLLVERIGRGLLLGLPIVFWLCLSFVAVFWWLMDATAFGQRIRAVGGNERAARAAGIPVMRVKMIAYVASAFSGGLLGILLMARVGSGDSTFGSATAIESIAAAVLGGTLLGGGVGRIGKVLPATLLLVMLANALNLAQIDSRWQALVLGSILILAVLLDRK